MNKNNKILIISTLILCVLCVCIFVYCVLYGKKNNNENYLGGVKSVDFTNYTNNELSSLNTITSGGVYTLSGDYEGTLTINADDKDVKLILSDVSIKSTDGPAIYIEAADVVYIELQGNNTITANTSDELNGAIYSKSDICFVGDGTINITSNLDGIIGKDDLEIETGTYIIKSGDDGIVGKDSLYILDGKFDITSEGDGLKTSNEKEKGTMTLLNGEYTINSKCDAITSIASLTIEGGNYKITSGKSSSSSYTNSISMKGLKSNGDLKIINGNIEISSTDDSIHTNSNLYINGGTIDLSSGDDGIHADKNVEINNGTINITKSYEGIEGLNIIINNGDIKVVASDDGFNASGGDGSSQGRPGSSNYNNKDTSVITINGGSIYINSSGDGIDSNGNIYITGGNTIVDGPTNNGNGPMDYGDGGSYKFEVTGGSLIAVGSKGMAVAPTNGTTITSVLINTDNTYNGTITFGDITYKPSKSYNSILICSSTLTVGNSYSLKINKNTIDTVSLNNTVTTSGETGFMGGPPGGPNGGRQNRGW